MDEADRAQVEIEHAMLGRMALARRRTIVPPTGECLNCGESLAPGVRWCDAGCRDDWSRLSAGARLD